LTDTLDGAGKLKALTGTLDGAGKLKALTGILDDAGKFGWSASALTGTRTGAGKSFGLERLLPRLSALALLLQLAWLRYFGWKERAGKLRMVCVSVSGM
jgi:hypothetical protein